jgi:hypothetical protein
MQLLSTSLQPLTLLPHWGPDILLSTLSLYSFLNVTDQVSHPYRTTGNIIVLYVLIFKFLDSRREEGVILISRSKLATDSVENKE